MAEQWQSEYQLAMDDILIAVVNNESDFHLTEELSGTLRQYFVPLSDAIAMARYIKRLIELMPKSEIDFDTTDYEPVAAARRTFAQAGGNDG